MIIKLMSIKKTYLLIPCLLATALLSGCASTKTSFECPYKGTAMCKRLDQVNQMYNRGELPSDPNSNDSQAVSVDTSQGGGPFGNFSQPFPMQYRPGTPMRYGETVMQAWIPPYVDKGDVFHQQSKIDLIVRKGHWIGYPVTSNNIE